MNSSIAVALFALALAPALTAQEPRASASSGAQTLRATTADSDSGPEVQAVLARTDELNQAFLQSDVASLERIIADECLQITQNGARTKAEWLAPYRSGASRFENIKPPEWRRVRLYGDVALVTSAAEIVMVVQGERRLSRFFNTRTWVKRSGLWYLVLAQNTPRAPETEKATAKMIQVGKANIEVFIRGAGPAVVLLPSVGGASQYDEFAPLLSAAGFQTIALSFRGAGGSIGPIEGLTLHDYAADVAGVIESLHVAPAYVLGRAGGNRVARCLASDRPQLVKSLILVAAGGRIPPSDPKAVAWLNGGPEAFTEAERPAAFRAAMLSPATDPARVNHIMSFFPSWPAAGKAFFTANAATPVNEWWAGGSARMLVIQGLDDLLAPPANGRALRDQYGDRVKLVEIPSAGHALLFEQPERVATEVIAFLKAPHRE